MNGSRLKRHSVAGVLALSLLASACSPSGAQTKASGASPDGELAPHFTVPTATGDEFSLSDYLTNDGRPLFLNLWASWCFPCREEMPAIDAASKQFPDIAFIGVAIQDRRADSEAFLKEVAVTYTIGFDDDGSVDRAYHPIGLPASYIISSDGLILERILGKVTQESLAEKFAKYFG